MSDFTAIVICVVTALSSAVPATISALKSAEAAHRGKMNTDKIEEVHHALNSALDKRVDSAKAEGNLEGRAEQTQERKEARKEA